MTLQSDLTNKEFIQALAVGANPTAILTAHSFRRDPSTGGNWTAHDAKKTDMLPSNNNYVSVSAFDGAFRRRANFLSLQAVMIDDLGTKLPMSDLKLKPTALIETSPGNFQAYLFLSQPITDINTATAFIDAMVDSGISSQNDPGMRGVTRVGRLPQGHNTKAKYIKPFKHITHEWNPDVRYTMEQIVEAYQLVLVKQTKMGPPRKRVTNNFDTMLDYVKENTNMYIAEIRPGYHKIVCPWFERHTDEAKTGTYYIEPSDDNGGYGGFVCHHGSCSDFHASQFNAFMALRKTTRRNQLPEFIANDA